MVRMLGSYYDDAKERNPEKVLPQVRILDVSTGNESRSEEGNLSRMENMRLDMEDNDVLERVGLTFDKGRILKIPLPCEEVHSWETVLASFPTDSRFEAHSILLSKMVTKYAKDNHHDLILYSDTATKIASKVLALTSQGRGFTLPWECGSLLKRNGPHPQGKVLIV